ncbi:polyphenol oxidase I, chloroplastic-like [Spinacia oleracea]|uniref:Polyphenol oxidase I, chloroplastic-like n=1 Tax=Spinacia oleracea TaxID=3562 RepID=A0A9R0IY42_SPIOL|nr:polyphenol oxidase I, chloroplastic-like [Spinacia oleracea]
MAAFSYSSTIFLLNPKPLFFKTSAPPIVRNRNRTNGFASKISCKLGKDDDSHSRTTSNISIDENSLTLNRRNILVGLGSLCGATTTTLPSRADPIAIDVTSCVLKDDTGLLCCPPMPRNIVDFKPTDNQMLRLRPAAHLVDNKYIDKYSKAIQLMKNLPDDDPRSFTQQANVHCAYCDEGNYHQLGFPKFDFLVHESWLFFPFHRCYLYLFEKILGKLIDDPSFALPFWNWDNPDGMYIPSMYTNLMSSSLYDPLRNENHLPPNLTDLSYDGVDNNELTQNELIASNLVTMYRQMVSNAKNPPLFFGKSYRAGDEEPRGAGTIEISPHNTVHRWTGDPTQPNGEDMGAFYSAARDPIFFAHHANIDRLWTIWKTLGGKRKDIQDPDWLNVSFLFYDENAQPIRIRVRDCLDPKKLGYVYQDVDTPWLNYKPTPSKIKPGKKTQDSTFSFPRRLDDTTIRTRVARPQRSRSKKQKEDEEEVLTIDLELLRMDTYIKFDVYINEEDDYPRSISRMNTEYAGCFVSLPNRKTSNKKTSFTVSLTDLIDDQGVDDDDSIEVSVVPISGSDALVITGMNIEFIS